MRRTLAVVIALAASAAGNARADEPAAEALFDRGVALMKEGRLDEACPLLARAVDLTAQPAVGGLLVLGECHEKAGRPATAWAAYRRAFALAGQLGQEKRRAAASEAIGRLERALPRVLIRVSPDLAVESGLRITRAGVEVPREAWNVAIPVDPGPRSVIAELPGKPQHRVDIVVGPGARTHDVRINRWDQQGIAATRPPPSSPSSPPRAPGSPPAAGSLEAIGVGGIVVGALGAAAVGVGIGVAFDAKAAYFEAIDDPANQCRKGSCLSGGKTATEAARAQGDVATGLVVAGGLVAATGAVLLVVDLLDGPPRPRPQRAGRPRGWLSASRAGLDVRF